MTVSRCTEFTLSCPQVQVHKNRTQIQEGLQACTSPTHVHVLAVRCSLMSCLIFSTVSDMRSVVSFSTSATHTPADATIVSAFSDCITVCHQTGTLFPRVSLLHICPTDPKMVRRRISSVY